MVLGSLVQTVTNKKRQYF